MSKILATSTNTGIEVAEKILVQSGGGGAQPTLFAPTISTKTLNTATWTESSSNGDFATTTTGTIDGTVVTTPLTITSAYNNKTLTVTTSASNFNSGVATTTLKYIEPVSGSSTAELDSTVTLGSMAEDSSFYWGPWKSASSSVPGIQFKYGTTVISDIHYFNVNTSDKLTIGGGSKTAVITATVVDNTLAVTDPVVIYFNAFRTWAATESKVYTDLQNQLNTSTCSVIVYLNNSQIYSGFTTANTKYFYINNVHFAYERNGQIHFANSNMSLSSLSNGDVITFIVKVS